MISDKYIMVALWCLIGLVISATAVSTLGAAFSVEGLAALFSGAATAVCAMAIALEFSKFVLAAYLHQRWQNLNLIFKSYLLVAIVVLSAITSMGIFGFLSNAYQSASADLEAENINLEALKTEKTNTENEIARLNKSIDEIPADRITKRMKLRAEIEPMISSLTAKSHQTDSKISESNLQILKIKQKVGPLIYISKAFQVEIDTVVKYLIMVFVFVFDPLAICLVIASSEALESRKKSKMKKQDQESEPLPEEDTEVIQMRFVDSKDQPAG